MRANNAELVNVRRIAEAALLIAIFSALAFQSLRFEQFETEKNAFLGILAAVIVGANLAEFIQLRRLPRIHSPLLWAVLGFFGVTAVSTLFSISPSYSFWGSPTRGHGLLMILIYIILFWQAMRSGPRLQAAIVPILGMTALAMIVYALQNYIETVQSGIIRFRPASTAGNPNYLAGWLAMFLSIFTLMAYYRVRSMTRPFQWWKLLEAFLYGLIVLLGLGTFVILSSRGAFAGFGVAIAVGTLIFLSLYKRRILLAGFVLITAAVIVGYLAVNQNFQEEGRSANFSGIERIFIVYDESRIVLWDAAVNLLRQQGSPFAAADGGEDNWAFLRPALGYGLETLEQTQERFGEEFHISRWGDRYVERFHNLFYDWSAEVGSLGLLSLIIIYQVAFYLGMRYLGFINQEQVWYWLLVQLVTVPLGVLITSRIIWQADWVSLIPLGGALGALLGTLVWIIRGAFVQSVPKAPSRLDERALTVIALMCVLGAQWIDNQFGFMQILSQTLFFILLGYLAYLTNEPEAVEAITYDEAEAIPESNYWFVATLVAGLFFLYVFGVAIDSDFTAAEIGVSELPYFLAALLVVGGILGTIRRYAEFELLPQATNGTVNSTRSKKGRSTTNARSAARSSKKRTTQPASGGVLQREMVLVVLLATLLIWPVLYGGLRLTNAVVLPPPDNADPTATLEPAYAQNFYDVLEYGNSGLLTLTAVVFLIGAGASVFLWFMDQDAARTEPRSTQALRSGAITLLFIMLAWLLFFFVRYLLMRTGSGNLDTALTTSADATLVRDAYGVLGLNGILLAALVIGTMYFIIKGRAVKFAISIVGMVAVLLFFSIGAILYMSNFTLATMRAAADGFTGQDIGPALVAADRIYAAAAETRPNDVKLRLSWADSLMTQIALINEQVDAQFTAPERVDQLLARVETQRNEALEASPYFIHSRTWEVFNQNYSLFRQRLSTIPLNPPSQQQPINPPANLPPGLPGENNVPPGGVQNLPPSGQQQPFPQVTPPFLNQTPGG
ncbi:MAG: hypothetical protein OHK0046_43390 [Anaerolineae bacterium]